MPPRPIAPKETTEAGSSHEGQNPSGGGNEPTDSGKEVQENQVSPEIQLFRSRQQQLFAAYHRFRYRNRPLAREEIRGMALTVWGGAGVMPPIPESLKMFDNPRNAITIELEDFISKNEQKVLGEVEGMFKTFLENDEEARDRCKNLDGLTKRLPEALYLHLPKWAGKELRPDQYALCYAILHFCRDHQNKRLRSTMYQIVVQQKVFNGTVGNVQLFNKFTNLDDAHTVQNVKIINEDRELVKHFARKAHDFFTQFELKRGKPAPLIFLPDELRRVDLKPETDLEATTRSVRSLALTATASGSREATETRTGKEDYDDLIDWEAYEGQGTMASSPPAGSSVSGPTGKGKEKEPEQKKDTQTRERESSSNSPGNGGSGRPAGKKPRREGKK